MKAKLLKKLRKIYIIKERNGKYKAFENRECSSGIYNQTDLINKDNTIEKRRNWILKEAQKYKVSKIFYNGWVFVKRGYHKCLINEENFISHILQIPC